jgi:hypothetical protein
MTTIRTFMFVYFRLWPFPLFAFTLGAIVPIRKSIFNVAQRRRVSIGGNVLNRASNIDRGEHVFQF